MHRARIAALLLLISSPAICFLVWHLFGGLAARPDEFMEGIVRDERGPLAGAVVRYQTTQRSVHSEASGRFRLPRTDGQSARVTAWKEGYLVGSASADQVPLAITLQRLPTEDNEAYLWVGSDPNPKSGQNCGNCHEAIYREWSASGHARSAHNRHFLNLYDGSDRQGRPGHGWSLLADHPDGAGVCTACHAPAVEAGDPAFYDLRKLTGTAAQGVHCDYCHKIADVENTRFGLTHGRFGLRLLRPARGQLFFGPLDDVDRGEDAFAPIYRESRYCASCHEGTVFGVQVYSTYSEWLQTPARAQGKQCQSCHMAPTGKLINLAPAHGGLSRDPNTLADHRLFADSQLAMLQNSLKLNAHCVATDKETKAEVVLEADQVGHRLPTGFIDRNLVLVVDAWGHAGAALAPVASSPCLPELAGKPLSGHAGKLFAKQLRDFDGRGPAPFWRAQPGFEDTRLKPGQPERSTFTFGGRAERVRVRLLYRHFWPSVANEKGWPDNELTVADKLLDVAPATRRGGSDP
jgi:Cytochrome c554 and c-prime